MTDDLKARTVRGVGWSALQSWGTSAISFLVYPVLARLLGPENYGLIAMAGVYISVLEIFLDVSFGAAIEQRKDLEPEHLDSIFWAFLVLGGVLTAGSMVAAPWVGAFFHEPSLAPIVRWLSLGFFLMMVRGVQTSLLRRELRIKALARRTLIATISGSALGISAALAGFGVWSLVVQRLVTQVVSVGLLWRISAWRPRPRFSRRHFQDLAPFGLSVMGYRILNYLRQRSDQILIGRYFGPVDLGCYFNARKLMTLATGALFGTYTQVSMPALAKLQDDLPRLRNAVAKMCRFLSLVTFPAFAGLSLLAADFTEVVLGPKWADSAPVLSILAISGIAQSIQYVSSATMMAVGQVRVRLMLMAAGTVLNLAAFVLTYRQGIEAVALAYTVCTVAMAPVDLLVNQGFAAVSLRSVARAVWVPAAATAAMSAAMWYGRALGLGALPGPARLGASVALGLSVYALAAFALDRRLWGDCRELAAMLVPGRRAQYPGSRR